MKTYSSRFKIALSVGSLAILAIFITRPALSQETVNKESHKKVTLKIVSDDNGKTTVIDTTMEMPDAMMMDSVKEEIEKVIMLDKGGKHARFKFHNMPQGFAYDFDVSPPPGCPMDMEELEGLEWEGMAPGQEMRIMRSGGHRQTLSDILGEIPMDRVVSYSIKDHKNGKRIIIDLNDAPMFERQERVVVIREPGRMDRNRNHPRREVKVCVNSDEDKQVDNAQEQPAPADVPPPPPPPPSDKPNKK